MLANGKASLQQLQSWISRKSAIEPRHQILMTGRGKQVKLQTIELEVCGDVKLDVTKAKA